MIVNIYTIYDKVAKECGPIFQAKNDDVANRLVKSVISDNSNIKFDEYELYSLGSFDTESLSFVPDSRFVLCDFNEIVKEDE